VSVVCPICSDVVVQPLRGRRRIFCTTECSRTQHKRVATARKSARIQARRLATLAPCVTCAGPIALSLRGPVPVTCSKFCDEVARGVRLAQPHPLRVCALDGCEVEFHPQNSITTCCSERHGKMHYNRTSRADGRQVSGAWDDRRRDNYHRRRALKKSASTGEPVNFSEIAARDQWLCGLCSGAVRGDTAWPDPLSPSLDHVVPLTRGGAHDPSNVQLAHLGCNTAKGNRIGEVAA
jgi:5-methylcytosine-specific restriction endonuclease McrA